VSKYGAQHEAKYHIGASSTWFAIKILLANDNVVVHQYKSFCLSSWRAMLNLILVGTLNPIGKPK